MTLINDSVVPWLFWSAALIMDNLFLFFYMITSAGHVTLLNTQNKYNYIRK